MNSLCDIVEKLFSLALLRNRCSTVQEEMVSSSSRNSSNVPRGRQGNTSFRQLSGACHRAKLQPDAKNAARCKNRRLCIIDATHYAYFADSATRSARTMTDDVLLRNEGRREL